MFGKIKRVPMKTDLEVEMAVLEGEIAEVCGVVNAATASGPWSTG